MELDEDLEKKWEVLQKLQKELSKAELSQEQLDKFTKDTDLFASQVQTKQEAMENLLKNQATLQHDHSRDIESTSPSDVQGLRAQFTVQQWLLQQLQATLTSL